MNDDFLYFDPYLCKYHAEKIKAIGKIFRNKIFTIFDEIEDDVNSEMDDFENTFPFDPEYSDPDDIWETVYDHGVEYGMYLQEAKCLAIAMCSLILYHDWEKSISKFLIKEISRNNPEPKISNWNHIIHWLKKYNTNLETMPFFDGINELRLATNAIKHGKGDSYNQLINSNSPIIKPRPDGECKYLSGEFTLLDVELFIEICDFERYKSALLNFWDHNFWKTVGEKRYKV